jgi:hypothetical protein
MSQAAIIGGVVLVMMVCSSSAGAAFFMMGPEEGEKCTPKGTKKANATYKYNSDGECTMYCNTGYTKKSGACVKSSSGSSGGSSGSSGSSGTTPTTAEIKEQLDGYSFGEDATATDRTNAFFSVLDLNSNAILDSNELSLLPDEYDTAIRNWNNQSNLNVFSDGKITRNEMVDLFSYR